MSTSAPTGVVGECVIHPGNVSNDPGWKITKLVKGETAELWFSDDNIRS